MTKINLDDLTLGQLKEINQLTPKADQNASTNKWDYKELINKVVFIRTVTFYYVGNLREVYDDILILEDAAWVANTGSFAAALKNGSFDEVEPFCQKRTPIGKGGIMDISEITLDLPLTQK